MQLSFDQLCALHGELVAALFKQEISVTTYAIEWDALVGFAGWTWDRVAEEIDKHWDMDKRAEVAIFQS